ncbi:hypothetical protein HNP52_002737 [Sphingomonas kyeonggiensis]|uniref:Uncharacterized protein n=1 Tax=Sphingomonas kyeonggiensis TaxID=1268553 RepID=A0A7W7K311_9SPHN|nr:hypothetical protein [Sphingomonas kyeonggiensis]MBB4839668.1 hypothetical protein [Sphingomonas kyeonggiensis]
MNEVFALWHSYELNEGEEESKLIGIYASHADAEAARARSVALPGFCDHPDNFLIESHTLGQDKWTEGFVTWRNGAFE